MLKARDIMTKKVITVNEDLPVRKLAKILSENRISGAPVVNDEGTVVGVVTESDLIDQAKKIHIPTVVAIFDAFLYLENPEHLEKELKKMAASTAGDISTRKFASVTEETPLDEMATMMAEENVHTLPVLEDGHLVGVIGKSDIIRTLAQAQ